MKIQFKVIWASLLFASFSAGAAAPGEAGDLVDLHTVTEITASTATVSAGLSGLNASARASGVHNVFLLGAIKKKPTGDQVGFYISWDTMEMYVAGRGVIAPIEVPLHSEFNGPATIESGTKLTALGSLKSLGVAFSVLQKKQKELEDGVITSLKVEDNHKVSQGSDRSPRISTPGANTGEEDDGFDITSFKRTGENTVREVDCNNRVDLNGEVVYRQSRKETLNYDGEIVSSGSCEDVGDPLKIYNDYEPRCGYDYDIKTDAVYQKAIKTFSDDGTPKWLTGCVIVSHEKDAISYAVSDVKCDREDNYLSHYSEDRIKKVADVGDGDRTFVDCAGTEVRYTHKDQPCSIGFDDNGKPYARHKVSITVDGEDEIIKDCTLDTSKSPYKKVLCAIGNRYEHKDDLGYSHPKMKIVDADENIVRGCTADEKIKYPIATDLEVCAGEWDDENRQILEYGRRSINGVDGEYVPLDKECEFQSETDYANGSVAWEMSSKWVELKPMLDYHKEWGAHRVDGVKLSTPTEFKYEYFKEMHDLETENTPVHESRTNEGEPLGCYYRTYGKPVWEESYSQGERPEHNWDFSTDWMTCDLNQNAGHDNTIGGYAKLSSFNLVETTARGDKSVMRRCSTSNAVNNVLGGIMPDGDITKVNDFEDCAE